MTAMITASAPAVIAGLDEVGRGALAGPVVAGACVLRGAIRAVATPFLHWVPADADTDVIITDSKKLSAEQRERSALWIADHSACGIGIIGPDIVDAHGILEATERSMLAALDELRLQTTPTYLLVDGHDHFFFPYPKSSVIHGDALEPCIAAASILAKVARDRIMVDYATDFPEYGFAQHKGYGTEEHCARIAKHGPCAIHRSTFLRNIMRASSDSATTPAPPRRRSAASTVVRV